MYKLFVKVLNKDKLSGQADTPWRAHPGLNNKVKPVLRALYKLKLTKRVGDLQWRILHGIVAVSALVSVINSNDSELISVLSVHREKQFITAFWTVFPVSAATTNVQDVWRNVF